MTACDDESRYWMLLGLEALSAVDPLALGAIQLWSTTPIYLFVLKPLNGWRHDDHIDLMVDHLTIESTQSLTNNTESSLHYTLVGNAD